MAIFSGGRAGRVVEHAHAGLRGALEQPGGGDVLEVEGRVLAHQHRVEGGQRAGAPRRRDTRPRRRADLERHAAGADHQLLARLTGRRAAAPGAVPAPRRRASSRCANPWPCPGGSRGSSWLATNDLIQALRSVSGCRSPGSGRCRPGGGSPQLRLQAAWVVRPPLAGAVRSTRCGRLPLRDLLGRGPRPGRDHAIGVKGGAASGGGIGQAAAGVEGQRLEVHARRVEVLVAAALG